VVYVTISETPVSWAYSPQSVHVVLGVNSTVEWQSRSISYDTVTSKNGEFDSGPIPPGGSYERAFVSQGTYEYYCVYHPWMVGVVVVTGP
jgi:plastocyanin